MKHSKILKKVPILLVLFSMVIYTKDFRRKIIADSLGWVGNFSNIKVLKPLKPGSRSLVNLVQDSSKEWYVIKQFVIPDFDIEFGIVREVLASLIGESVGVPLNKVRIIPSDQKFPGKMFMYKPATIHTFASGDKIHHIQSLSGLIHLRQSWPPEKKKRGLTQKIIQSMSLFPELPVVVAFDTFVSNSGRHNGNLFYDEKTKKFCGIDLESSFRKPFDKDFCQIAYENLIKMKHEGIKFSQQEINGLKIYNDTLKRLIEKNSPKKLHDLLDQIVELAGFDINFYQQLFKQEINLNNVVKYYKNRITQQYQNAQKLIKVLDEEIL